MPNHCSNDLRIKGPAVDRTKFIQGIKDRKEDGESLSFLNAYFPCPVESQGDWYSWSNTNWGTKWGDYDVSFDTPSKTNTVMHFNSAWSPPCEGLLEVSKKFPTLTFLLKFYERGMAYKGVYECKNGEIIDESEAEYHGSRGG